MGFVAQAGLGTVLTLRRYLLLITRVGVLLLLALVIVLLWLVCWPVVGPFEIRRFDAHGAEKHSADVAPALSQPSRRPSPSAYPRAQDSSRSYRSRAGRTQPLPHPFEGNLQSRPG